MFYARITKIILYFDRTAILRYSVVKLKPLHKKFVSIDLGQNKYYKYYIKIWF